jgi:hypothetical protein
MAHQDEWCLVWSQADSYGVSSIRAPDDERLGFDSLEAAEPPKFQNTVHGEKACCCCECAAYGAEDAVPSMLTFKTVNSALKLQVVSLLIHQSAVLSDWTCELR